MFTADTTDSIDIIGAGTAGDTSPVLVELDSSTSEPTAVNGAIYYNSTVGNFRCGESGVWENCIGGLLSSNTGLTTVASCTTACAAVASYTVPANYCWQGRVIKVYAAGYYESNGSTDVTQLQISLGATLLGRGIAQSGATSSVVLPWEISYTLICDGATFSSETVNGQGYDLLSTNATGGNLALSGLSQNLAQAGTTFTEGTGAFIGQNMSTSEAITINPYFSVSNASNEMVLSQFVVTGM
jgi:hypothetical protein